MDHLKLSSPLEDEVFHHYLPGILEDLGMSERLHEDGIQQEIWDSMPHHETIRKKGDKVGLARFMSALYRARDDDKNFHIRAWQYTIMALRLGFESKKKRLEMIEDLVGQKIRIRLDSGLRRAWDDLKT